MTIISAPNLYLFLPTKLLAIIALLFAGCQQLPEQPISTGHLQNRPPIISNPPPIVKIITPPPMTAAERKRLETYNVIVKDVDIRDLLFSISRDAKVDVDISPDVKGSVTINAVRQTLPQILDRLSANFDMAYELVDGVYRISPDKPSLRSYRVEYPNINRSSTSETKLNSLETGNIAGSSKTDVTTNSKNEFWVTLIRNIKEILSETDKEITIRRKASNDTQKTEKVNSGLGNTATTTTTNNNSTPAVNNSSLTIEEYEKLTAATVIANPEAGIMQVRATARQHAKVKEFLDLVLQSSRRQVLIEATVAEVQLSQKYEKGIDWKILGNLARGGKGLIGFGTGLQDAVAGTLNALNGGINALEIGLNTSRSAGDFFASLRLLEEFGSVKVLSSPKLSVLNNQSAILKVTDNYVYFTTGSTTTEATALSGAKTTYTSTMAKVPIGFVMSVIPFIGQDGTIQLNLRPSISRIIDYVKDPGPGLSGKTYDNYIPVVRSREIESIMRIRDGNIAVLGGLMEDYISGDLGGLPGITRTPGIGQVFGNDSQNRRKTELVIFIRPTVINNADINGDYQLFRDYLIDENQFQQPHPTLAQ